MQQCRKIALLFIFLLNEHTTAAFKDLNYCYTEEHCKPPKWVKNFPLCKASDSSLQSPIDLQPNLISSSPAAPLEVHDFNKTQRSWTVANVRNTVVVEFDKGMTVKVGGLKHEYQMVELRFHWGSNASNGSEHTLNKRRFPMEMQIVSKAPSFADVEKASTVSSGLLMIGIFIDIGGEVNKHFKAISDAITNVPYPGNSVRIAPPALSFLIPGNIKFYRYRGGLTTPPCNQTVDWIVFEEPIFVSRNQCSPFTERLYYSNKNDSEQKLLLENYRSIQASLNRSVSVSSVVKFLAGGAARDQHALFVPFLVLSGVFSFNVA